MNFDDLVNGIGPDNACGDDLQYDPQFIGLEQAIKGKPEQQIGDTITEAEPPNWREVKKQSEALLLRTIDLRVLICYLRALLALEGFSGFEEGLALIRGVVEKQWQCLHPQLDPDDDNDPTERINALLSLCDHDALLWPLQQTPLLESHALGRFSFRQISIASGKSTATNREQEVDQTTIDAAIQDSGLAPMQQTFQAITTSLDNLSQLENLITGYVGSNDAPSFEVLRSFLKECLAFLRAGLEAKGGSMVDESDVGLPAMISEADSGKLPASTHAAVNNSVVGIIHNNQDVIKMLNLVCDYYRKNEPSSPVPFFIDRAIKMVGKDFMDVLKDIAPSGLEEAKVILGKQLEEDNS
ncbi:MAG: type VI secretion system protein TssA [Methylococcales bacterium]|nr:type VI secretion system protein TssA [Methylococcales bacterium]